MTNLFSGGAKSIDGGSAASLMFVLFFSAVFFFGFQTTVKAQFEVPSDSIQKKDALENFSPDASPNLVISQFYGGGGQSGAQYTNDFVELLNRGTTSVSLNGWSVQYAGASGTNWLVTPLSNVTLAPGQYYLIQYASNGAVGSALPTPDLIAPAVTSGTNTFVPNLSATTGKLALVNSTTQLPAQACPVDVSIIDLVGYGSSATCSETAPTANLNNSSSAKRNGNGCTDSDNNANDFTVGTPLARNTSSPTTNCGNPAANLTANGNANPTTVAQNGTVLLTVRVFPATSPASSGIGVTADLTAIGGSATQQFYDDGMNGDATAGDNIFSFNATIPGTQAGGQISLLATATDAQGRTANASINFSVLGTTAQVHLTMGNPSNATADVNNPNNYLLLKNQYAVSYNRDRKIPNWVSWHLDSSWLGSTSRQDDFRPDPTLPAGWYQVTPEDYSGSGFDRGHHTPSGDRTSSVENNSATFLMTNMMPQAGGNNQGPWNNLENDSRALVNQGNELYIVAGSVGVGGYATTANTVTNSVGNGVVVPAYTWKVIIVLPSGTNDVSRVTASTRTIAVIMPNRESIRNDNWRKYIATVDQVEALTGYDFFSNVPVAIQNQIESRLDAANNTLPQSISGGTYANLDVFSPNTTLTGNVTVTGNLNLAGSWLNTGNFKITLGPSATVSRISGYVVGQIEKQFSNTGSLNFVYPVGTANGYSPVSATLTALGVSPSSLTVSATQGAHPNVPDATRALQRYWTLTENGDLTANLTFQYLDVDIPSGVPYESALRLNRYENGFTVIPSTFNTTDNTIWANNISQFSDWTAFTTASPTAAAVTIGGRVMTDRGKGLANARVLMTNSNGETMTAITNQFGYYRIADVTVGETYILSIASKRYVFQPQAVTINEETNDLNFSALTAVPNF